MKAARIRRGGKALFTMPFRHIIWLVGHYLRRNVPEIAGLLVTAADQVLQDLAD